MGNLLILFATAASLLLGACGSDVEESAGTPVETLEESAGTSVDMLEESAGTPVEESTETSILADRLAHRIQAGSPPLILDIRKREDFADGHVPGAINIPLHELPTRLTELPTAKSEEIVIVQYHVGRSARKAEAMLRGSGYSNIRELTGHWRKWKAAGLPTE
jgi:rhodanese-related sulfurtransferase